MARLQALSADNVVVLPEDLTPSVGNAVSGFTDRGSG
jgi:hypothetical protein